MIQQKFQCPLGLELLRLTNKFYWERSMFQCPLGLIPHFYTQQGSAQRKNNVSMPSRAYTSFLQVICDDANDSCKREFQCPLGLIPHFYCWIPVWLHRKRTAVSMPSRAYTSVPLQKPRFYAVSRACFCRYLSEYSDSSCFSCMLTFWTYLMRCTYPWHWIKYSTNYNRCHPIFFTLLISWAEQ